MLKQVIETCVCMRACVRVCVSVCVRACVCACVQCLLCACIVRIMYMFLHSL